MEFDTNKLPPLTDVLRGARKIQRAEIETISVKEVEEVEEIKISRQKITTEIAEMPAEIEETEEMEEFVPFMTRFNAGLFDLLGGSFATLVLLAPFMLFGGEWFTFWGLSWLLRQPARR